MAVAGQLLMGISTVNACGPSYYDRNMAGWFGVTHTAGFYAALGLPIIWHLMAKPKVPARTAWHLSPTFNLGQPGTPDGLSLTVRWYDEEDQVHATP